MSHPNRYQLPPRSLVEVWVVDSAAQAVAAAVVVDDDVFAHGLVATEAPIRPSGRHARQTAWMQIHCCQPLLARNRN